MAGVQVSSTSALVISWGAKDGGGEEWGKGRVACVREHGEHMISTAPPNIIREGAHPVIFQKE